MDTTREVIAILRSVLGLRDRLKHFDRETRLLDSLPELDSMAVASVLTTIEERFGVSIADDEIDGTIFANVGTLVDFVDQKLAR